MKFVENVWYKNSPQINTYAKCFKDSVGIFDYKEYIENGKYKNNFKGFWSGHPNMESVNLSEIQQYLPDNHVDKMTIKTNIICIHLTRVLNKYNIK